MFHPASSLHIFTRLSILAAAAIAALAVLATAPASSSAGNNECDSGATGGISLNVNDCKPIKKARLINGKAVAPASAPARVQKVIKAANKIRTKKYIYGGGHGLSKKLDRGYDCSGSVSYALRAGGFIKSPMASGGFIKWKKKGAGRWISTYANGRHMYMVVAGLRFDTSAMRGNGNNRWTTEMRSSRGFSERHPGKY